MPKLEVLIRELLSVDGLATGALQVHSQPMPLFLSATELPMVGGELSCHGGVYARCHG